MTYGVEPDVVAAFVAEGGGVPAINPRFGLAFTVPVDRLVVDDAFLDPVRRDRWPIYRRLFDPYDAGIAAQARLSASTEVLTALSIVWPRRHDGFDRRVLNFVEAATPKIAAAVGAALTLGTHADAATVTTAEALDGAVVLLGADGMIVSLSPAAEAVVRSGCVLALRSGRLVAVDPENARTLDELMVGATAGDRRGAAVLRDASGGGVRVELSPLGRGTSGPLSLARALLTIRGLDGASPVVARAGGALATRFGLTAAETEIAMLLARGRTLRQIAAERDRSYDTIRAQVRAVFDKTGRHRQADLIALVRGLE